VLHLIAATKLAATGAALVTGLFLAATAHAGIVPSQPKLESTVSGSLFDGGKVLYPGSPAETRTTTLTYTGGTTAGVVGLYLENYQARGPQSASLCTAADPGQGYEIAISGDGVQLYRGTLAQFATGHSSSQDLLAVPGTWTSGTSHTVTIAVDMPRGDGNEYMTCSPTTDFVWLAQ
jgi:hypothetical protein